MPIECPGSSQEPALPGGACSDINFNCSGVFSMDIEHHRAIPVTMHAGLASGRSAGAASSRVNERLFSTLPLG